MQLRDQRHTTHTLEYNELNQKEKDEFATYSQYMQQYRHCSLCGVTFSLSRSLANGTECPTACQANQPRDHVDCNTEDIDKLDSITVPYRLHLVLKSKELWPTHRYIDSCTKNILPENSTRQPEAVTVYRNRFVPGPLNTAKLSPLN